MINLLHIVDSIEVGGLENGIVNLANCLDATEYVTTICCIRREGQLKSRLKPHVRVICLRQKDGFNPFIPFSVAKICRENKINIVHTHGWAGGLYAGVIGARLAAVDCVINGEHGVFSLKKRQIRAQKILFGMTDVLLSVSEDLKKDIIRIFSIRPDKILPIVNGVDTERFKSDVVMRQSIRNEFGFADNEIVIGSVGRLVQIKDYKSLIESCALLIKAGQNIKVLLVGDGDQRKNLHELAVLHRIEKKVIFAGQRDDIPNLLNAMDIFVLPSIDEGLSNTILEAMSAGKPVIATNVGGNREIITDRLTGMLITPQKPQEITLAIRSLLLDGKLFEAISKAGAANIREKFSMERMISRYDELYRSYLRKKMSRKI